MAPICRRIEMSPYMLQLFIDGGQCLVLVWLALWLDRTTKEAEHTAKALMTLINRVMFRETRP